MSEFTPIIAPDLRAELEFARQHLYSAIIQRAASDDRIIAQHIDMAMNRVMSALAKVSA